MNNNKVITIGNNSYEILDKKIDTNKNEVFWCIDLRDKIQLYFKEY